MTAHPKLKTPLEPNKLVPRGTGSGVTDTCVGCTGDVLRVTFPQETRDPVWSLGKLGTWDPHALWREESVSDGACSEF